MPAFAAYPTPFSTPAETVARDAFTTLMWALSYPGRTAQLPASPDNLATIGATLLDLETTFFTPDAALLELLEGTGARTAKADVAAYHFYPAGVDPQVLLAAIAAANVGTLLYPDQAATLVIGVTLGRGQRLHLSGPGIPGTTQFLIDGLPNAFWDLRTERSHYPLGWDLFFVDNNQVIGLPRTTTVEKIRD